MTGREVKEPESLSAQSSSEVGADEPNPSSEVFGGANVVLICAAIKCVCGVAAGGLLAFLLSALMS